MQVYALLFFLLSQQRDGSGNKAEKQGTRILR